MYITNKRVTTATTMVNKSQASITFAQKLFVFCLSLCGDATCRNYKCGSRTAHSPPTAPTATQLAAFEARTLASIDCELGASLCAYN